MKPRQSWHQQEGESGSAYVRFLLFRNLGPCRTNREAYFRYLQRFDNYQGGRRGIRPPRTWREECAKQKWVDRATAWDVHRMQMEGARIAALHASTVRTLAARCAELAKEIKPGDDRYPDFMNTVRTVGQFLSPELIRGVQERYRPVHRDAVAASASGEVG